jgi:MOSC domain-containing protein YiiM
MDSAIIIGIYISEKAAILPHSIESAEVTRLGVVGDRYYHQAGTFSTNDPTDAGRSLTLIEQEALEKYAAEYGVDLSAAEVRRNVITQGIALNDLVDREFYIGAVRAKGIRLCHPCRHLQQLTEKPVLAGLENCGGLRADVLEAGVIRVGDRIRVV